ncbi:hypothetical protein T484DRAFT_1918945 [Baffinella frigidus]|nr:hypothetical protein T484DRAFT_1918945 [Cryptophyta sp. CCMP2293]
MREEQVAVRVKKEADALDVATYNDMLSVDIDPNMAWLVPHSGEAAKLQREIGGGLVLPAGASKRQQGKALQKADIGTRAAQRDADDPMQLREATEILDDHETVLQAQEGQRVALGNMNFDAKAMREQFKNPEMMAFFKNLPKTRRRGAALVENPKVQFIEAGDKVDSWTYQRLVDCAPIAEYINRVLFTIRDTIPKFFQKAKHAYQFEFLICIDNSGSMYNKAKEVHEALVVLIEVMRKLEFRFAIALWGTWKQEKLLLNFDDEFNAKKGQEIIESLTFTGASEMADCMTSLAKKVWPDGKRPPNTQRLVITLTDGLTNQNLIENFIGLKEDHGFKLGILLIRDLDDGGLASHEDFLQGVCEPRCWEILNANQLKGGQLLVSCLIAMLTNMFEVAKTSLLADERDVDGEAVAVSSRKLCAPEILDLPPSFYDIKMFATGSNAVLHDDESRLGGGLKEQLFSVSAPDGKIPLLADAHQDVGLDKELERAQSSLLLDDGVSATRAFYELLQKNPHQDKIVRLSVSAYWDKTVKELAPQIEDYVSVLEEFVLPLNKYTRRRGALKGSSLHLSGLVKAVLSNFTYKKIYSQKTAGGKRNYSVCLVVDVSASMNGHLAEATQESLFCLIAALLQSHIDFSIVLFGQHVRLIKTDDQEWSPGVFWSLLAYCKKKENVSMDADGIDFAVQLVGRGDGEKKVFVFTDGYGTCGLRLPLVLERAEKENVDVVGIAVGVDRTWVQHAFRRYIVAMVPAVVPQALRALYLEEGTADDSELKMDLRRVKNESVEDILNTQRNIFDAHKNDMNQAREATLVNTDDRPEVMTVDVAFCLDCTGSMSAWISAAKTQILTIATQIEKKFKEDKKTHGELEIKFAVVAYRDYDKHGETWIQVFPANKQFTKDSEAFCRNINSLVATGGEDGPEDLLGALQTAGTELHWGSRLKFLVVITDSPAHGSECNSDPFDRYKGGDPKDLSMIGVMKTLTDKKIDLMFCRIKKTNTAKTEAAMAKHYNLAADCKMTTVDLFDADAKEATRFHFVFCLDESTSMTFHKPGAQVPWDALLLAYAGFLNKRKNDQGGDDLVSVVTFAMEAHIQYAAVPIMSVSPSLAFHGGGTSFTAALEGASEVLAKTPQGSIPMLIFMSDGEDNHHVDVSQKVALLRSQYERYGFVCNCVGLGDDVNMGPLHAIAKAGGGKAQPSSVSDISAVFGEIAAGCSAMDGMVAQFGEKIAGMVKQRICYDHF